MGTIRGTGIAVILSAWTSLVFAQEAVLFNGKDLADWSFHLKGEPPKDIDPKKENSWIVQDGLLVFTGAATSYVRHKDEFDNYELNLEWRSMKANANGVTVGCVGSVFIHTAEEKGAFGYPKCIEVSLRDIGAVYLRDIEAIKAAGEDWAFRAPEDADEVEKDLGEWNQLKLIVNGKRLTVIVNGTPVNQIDKLNRTKGAIALESLRGFIPAPMYFRNIRILPLTSETQQAEQAAVAHLAAMKAKAAARRAAQDAQRLKEEQAAKAKADAFDKQWVAINVTPDIEFKADARMLPFPKDAQLLRFRSNFGHVELSSPTPLAELSKFYRTEMARRGWQEGERKRDEDSVDVSFQHDKAKVQMSLSQRSKGVEIRLVCKGLSFDGTDDPAGLVALGIPQPAGYVALQQQIKLPDEIKGLEFDNGNRCMFKCKLLLQEAFDQFSTQLKANGYRETRKPLTSDNRRYTEFGKGRARVTLNIFSDDFGSRVILTCEEK